MVVGTVQDADGNLADGANVFVSRVQLASGYSIPLSRVIATSNRGKFVCPFVWDDWDTFTHDPSVIRIQVGAYLDDNPVAAQGKPSNMIAKAVTEIPGYLHKDIFGMERAMLPDLGSVAGVADFSVSIGSALAEWNGLVPFWNVHHLASSAHWLIVGGARLYMTG
ncbi:MAG TPA: hypothetical protein VIK18_11670 [Pirellulales bacterium]